MNITYEDNAVIFAEGSVGKEIYIVESEKVTLMPLTREEILLERQLTVDLLQALASRLRSTTSTPGNIIASMVEFLPKTR